MAFSHGSRAVTAKKCTKKPDARVKSSQALSRYCFFGILVVVTAWHLTLPNNYYNPLLSVRSRIFLVQIEMLLLVACKMFFQLISRSFVSDLEVSLASTTLANEPDKYGETIAIVFELTKRTQEMLFADWAQ